MYTSFQIANYFIKRSQDSGVELSPMKLIKLCYIAHGWHLGLTGNPLLGESIYAWKYGPVVGSIYQGFKKYGGGQIKELIHIDGEYPMVKDSEIAGFLDVIWDAYSSYDGVELSSMTHNENTPWDIVWNKKNGKRSNDAIIPNDIIQNYYKEKLNSKKKS